MNEVRASKEFERDIIALMPRLNAFAQSLTKDSVRAEDLVQETVMKALANHHSFTPGTKLSAWLFTILRNEFYTRHRKTKREVEDPDDLIAKTVEDTSAVAPDGGDELAAVMAQLDALDPDTKGILLDVAAGTSYDEAAAKYNLAVGTVKSRINRARAVLIAARNGGDDEADDRPIRTDLFPITEPKFARAIVVPKEFGTPPVLIWLPVDRLRIDPRYQREILDRGKKNVGSIAEAFDWGKFGTVVVADIGGGLYAVIDGQHRTTAAKICGITSVPCQIIEADLAQQAQAFAAINGNVTALSSLQIHQARIAAGDADTVRLEKIAAAAECKILRYPVPADKIGPRQTMAVGTLRSCMKRYGDDILIAALSCLTQTRGGNPGYLRQQIIQALCAVLSVVPQGILTTQWAVEKARTIRFDKIWVDAHYTARSQRKQVAPFLILELKKHFGVD